MDFLMRKKTLLISALLGFVLLGILGLWNYLSNGKEETAIRNRYQEMRNAMASGDTNAVLEFFVPEVRNNMNAIEMVYRFAKPLDGFSSVKIQDSGALICPEQDEDAWFLPSFIQAGHRVEMIKVDGEWFFTGEVDIF